MEKIYKNRFGKVPALFLLLLFVSVSCEKELDKSPLSSFSNTTFWTSEQNTLLALTGVYRGNHRYNGGDVNPTDWWSYSGLLFPEMATDNAYDRRGDSSPLNRLTNGTLVNNNGLLQHYWSNSYSKIARCNYFMENVVKAPVSQEKLKRMVAEARFLRAAEYFYLSQHFGAVPLVTKVLTVDEANTITKTSKQAVVEFIISEFAAAAADLPRHKDIPSAEFGRASKQAALAFQGRSELAAGKFADAAKTYKAIIDFNDNIIDPNYESLFNGSNETSNEIIFSSVFVENLLGNALRQKTHMAVAGGWVFFCPLGNLVESYEFTDGTPFSFSDPRYDHTDIRKNRDPRLGYTIFVNGATFGGLKYVSHPDSTTSADQVTNAKAATRTGYALRKYMVESYAGDPQRVGNDIPVIRYAEVLLSYLEAKLEAGDAIDQGLLDATVNKVRGRASVNMPPVTTTDPAALRIILRRERRNELACEGIRYWDLLRWGIAGTVLQGRFFGAPFPTAKTLRKDGAFADPEKRWFVTKKAFRVGQDETWPVPLGEVNINPNLQ
ncbi:RagB/SusD family nutrient uptake outer membrane protein [Botryobacter ruber]|uniref:RagB/SusD family nutrient uptake outer membrane protein n=1 Tax=Botryobacter ruber TaxID=2171629 RepID=UPI000E0B82CC|nr:RagB/SusD family nutrient uptake outer membrane protein [Botryobacter ruber]